MLHLPNKITALKLYSKFSSPPKKKPAKSKPTPKAEANQPHKATSPNSTTAPPTDSLSKWGLTGNQEVYWLFKAEPLPRYENGVNVAFSISDLRACTAPEPWSGVRNPQARNNMQAMKVGDLGFFYHSNAKPSGIVGIMRVVKEAHVDETAFDPEDPYYDPKSKDYGKEKPKWFCVDVEFVKEFGEILDLATIKGLAGKGGALEGMQLVTHSRLSVCRVSRAEWGFILGFVEARRDSRDDKKEKEKEGE